MRSNPADRSWDVFISYAEEDVDCARPIRDGLAVKGWRCFFAADDLDLQVGTLQWSERIDQLLEEIPAVAVVASRHGLASRWVTYEWRSLHNDILAEHSGVILPICISDVTRKHLPPALRAYQVLELRTDNLEEVLRRADRILRGFYKSVEKAERSLKDEAIDKSNAAAPRVGTPVVDVSQGVAINVFAKSARPSEPTTSAQALLERYAAGHRDFERAQLEGARLPSVDLAGANLARANLTAALLSDSNLSGANLKSASLGGTNLAGARFSGADLTEADFTDADLSGADLAGAVLHRTRFTSTRLDSVELSGAHMLGTILDNVDLSTVEPSALSDVVHDGPSAIGTNTMRRSRGRIPPQFLRGCGLADWEIETIKLYDLDLSAHALAEIQMRAWEARSSAVQIQRSSVFISYSHADKDFARGLYHALQNRGIRCWLDEQQLLPGDDIHEGVNRGIALWDKILLCASEASLKNSWWVDHEISSALAKEQALTKERGRKTLVLIPLDLDGYLYNGWQSGKRDQVLSRVVGDFTNWQRPNFDMGAAIEPLVKALRADGGGRDPPSPPRL